MPMMRFQCPECGMGDYEVGHLVAEPVEYCVVCLDEHGRLIRLEACAPSDLRPWGGGRPSVPSVRSQPVPEQFSRSSRRPL